MCSEDTARTSALLTVSLYVTLLRSEIINAGILAIALASRPQILLLDEATAGLDAEVSICTLYLEGR